MASYESVRRPPGSPPSGWFGPIWATIYTLYGALFAILVWKRGSVTADVWWVYTAGWIVNLIWIPIFRNRFTNVFNPLYILLLLGVILALAGLLWSSDSNVVRLGALLLIPYIVWLNIAICLGFSLYRLNL